MPKLKTLTPKQIIKLLEEKGFRLERKAGSHFVYYNSSLNKIAVVPFHSKNLPKGTMISILKQAEINLKELR